MTIKQAFFEWLTDMLSPWFIPRKDFNELQRFYNQLDVENDELVKELEYSFKSARQAFVDANADRILATEIVTHERIDFDAIIVSIRVPRYTIMMSDKPLPLFWKRVCMDLIHAFIEQIKLQFEKVVVVKSPCLR